MVRSHAAAGAAITGNAYAAAKATGTAATETTEAAATASRRIAGTPTHGSAFAQSRTKKNRAIYVAQVTYRGQRPLLFCPSRGPRGIATLAIRRQAEAGPCERKTPIYAAATHVEAAW